MSTFKIASYFTSEMSLLGNGRGIAIQHVQAMANHMQVQRTKENITLQRKVGSWWGSAALKESPLEESKNSGW